MRPLPAHIVPAQRCVPVRRLGQVETRDYAELLGRHRSNAWFGCTVAFRALQRAAATFPDGVLPLDALHIVSAHPGPGVRDAIEYVTGCVSGGRFELDKTVAQQSSCNRAMRFAWKLRWPEQGLAIGLRDDIVPAAFFELAERVSMGNGSQGDRSALDALKQRLSERIWNGDPASDFIVSKLNGLASSHA